MSSLENKKIRIISPPDHSNVPPYLTVHCESDVDAGYTKEIHIDGYIYSKVQEIVLLFLYLPT